MAMFRSVSFPGLDPSEGDEFDELRAEEHEAAPEVSPDTAPGVTSEMQQLTRRRHAKHTEQITLISRRLRTEAAVAHLRLEHAAHLT